jgi:hypothetical protein
MFYYFLAIADLLDLLDGDLVDNLPVLPQTQVQQFPVAPTFELSSTPLSCGSAQSGLAELPDISSSASPALKAQPETHQFSNLSRELQAQLLENGFTVDMIEGLNQGGKSCKSAKDVDVAIERIKKKRRESAQRSRARKSVYIKALEKENEILSSEVMKLRAAVARAIQLSEQQQRSQEASQTWQNMPQADQVQATMFAMAMYNNNNANGSFAT